MNKWVAPAAAMINNEEKTMNHKPVMAWTKRFIMSAKPTIRGVAAKAKTKSRSS